MEDMIWIVDIKVGLLYALHFIYIIYIFILLATNKVFIFKEIFGHYLNLARRVLSH